jgi:hypothetical protein
MGIGQKHLHPSYTRMYFEIVRWEERSDTHRLSGDAENRKKELEMFTLRHA